MFSITIKVVEQILPVCIVSDDYNRYLVIVYPPIENVHICLLEQHTRQLIRLIKFLFGSIYRALLGHAESIAYFFDVFFYRLNHLLPSPTNTSPVLKNLRLIDEFLPAQFDSDGTCPTLIVNNQQLIINIDGLLNQLECQSFNECSNDNENIINRYRRAFFLNGSVLFHRAHLLISHLSNELTNDVYRFLLHYGHLNMPQASADVWQLLLFKEIYPTGHDSKYRSFVIVCSQGDLTLAVTLESEYDEKDIE